MQITVSHKMQKNIETIYGAEYHDKAAQKGKGFLYSFYRFAKNMDAAVLSVMGGLIALSILPLFTPPVTAAVCILGFSVVPVIARMGIAARVEHTAKKDMAVDIASGALVSRYAEEILKPAADNARRGLAALEESYTQAASLAREFRAAQENNAPAQAARPAPVSAPRVS